MDSAGKCLKQARELRNLSLDEVSESTRIKKYFLKAMEEDRFDLCPPSFYVKGFLANYARYLGLAPRDILFKYQERIKPPLFSPEVSPQKKLAKTFEFHPKIRTRNPARMTYCVLLVSVLFVSLCIPLYFYIVLQPLRTSNALFPGPKTIATSELVRGKGDHPVLEQIKQMELIGVQKVHAGPFYEVSDAHLGTGIEMEGGRPKVVGKGSEFKCENQRIYFFTRIAAPKEGKVWHVWYWEGKEHRRIEMVVKPPSWSVYSYVSLPPARSGNWRVEVRGGDKILVEVGFRVHSPGTTFSPYPFVPPSYAHLMIAINCGLLGNYYF